VITWARKVGVIIMLSCLSNNPLETRNAAKNDSMRALVSYLLVLEQIPLEVGAGV
jgi:hypothetical protein